MEKFSLDLRNHNTANNLVENASKELWLSACSVREGDKKGQLGNAQGCRLHTACARAVIWDLGAAVLPSSLPSCSTGHRHPHSIAACGE